MAGRDALARVGFAGSFGFLGGFAIRPNMGRVRRRGKGSLSPPRPGARLPAKDINARGGRDDRNQTHTPHAVGRACGRAAHRACQRASRLAEPAGARSGALSAGRRRRHHGAHPLRQGRRHHASAIHRREPRRRRRHHRRSHRRQGRSRRLHAVARRHRFLGERFALSEPVVRLPQGFRAGVPGVAGAQHPGGHAVAAGDDDGRRHRLRQGAAGRHQHGVVRQRHAAASVPGNVPPRHRPQDQPRALSRRRAGAHRRDVGAGEILLRQRLLGGRPAQGRQAESHRAYRLGAAREPARHSAGVRHAAGLRGQ